MHYQFNNIFHTIFVLDVRDHFRDTITILHYNFPHIWKKFCHTETQHYSNHQNNQQNKAHMFSHLTMIIKTLQFFLISLNNQIFLRNLKKKTDNSPPFDINTSISEHIYLQWIGCF